MQEMIFAGLSWPWSQFRSYSSKTPEQQALGAPRAPAASASSSPAVSTMSPASEPASSSAGPKVKRDATSMQEFYKAWEDVGDGVAKPDIQRTEDEFSALSVGLDVSKKLTKYAWDQSSKTVSVYLTLPGVQNMPEGAVEVKFGKRGVMMLATDETGKKSWFKIPNLCKVIDGDGSTFKIKEGQVVLKLKKTVSETWSDLTDEKDIKERQRQHRIQHGDLKNASTQELLADMYQSANDEDRAGLESAMRVNREKREEDARNARAQLFPTKSG
jgi:hypothetical protein